MLRRSSPLGRRLPNAGIHAPAPLIYMPPPRQKCPTEFVYAVAQSCKCLPGVLSEECKLLLRNIKVRGPMAIIDWPVDDRPREKLLSKGPGSLSDAELL